ncbi:DUF2169 family type VI secretion system accessory protein [Labrys sp. 22185]|uniref:DUF2169 family type VI secretion system accessory protein n=1 Tax=Labrys sp. 22185 TaxID=3453888 RepID=UPI003F84D1C2
MSVDNRTPFPAIAFQQYNLAGQMLGVVAARGTFKLARNGPLQTADTQYPLVLADRYENDAPHDGPLVAQSDLTPFKPGTDITFLGAAHSSDGMPRPDWTCRLEVGSVSKTLRVTGPRQWKAKTRKRWQGRAEPAPRDVLEGWDLTEPEPVSFVPLDWRLAYGGLLPGRTGNSPSGRYRLNALGQGMVDDSAFREKPFYPAPQIESPDRPLISPYGDIAPEGFGPIPPWWDQRHRYAGTYDDDWLEERHPLLPTDFDFRFWQCAHPDLIADPWLKGDEAFELEHLLPGLPKLNGHLPGLQLRVSLDQGDGPKMAPLVLDGVHFDMRPGVGRVFLTWRAGFPWLEGRGVPVVEALHLEPEARA